ncbi:MAG TPA: DUF177 domain-containing protein [Anaerolineaceae bacterium]|jgi:uncharacterized protein|nr:DUF177 domain-containing protein [Anaerolineaceae bacterium]
MIHESIGNYRDLDFKIEEIELESDLQLSNVSGKVRINRTPQGLLIDSNFEAFVVDQCVRCLEDFQQQLTTEFQELYAYRSRHTKDAEFFVPEDGFIDLSPLVYENMLLAIPIKAICRPDCKGLCIQCGINLNHETCEHEDSRVVY